MAIPVFAFLLVEGFRNTSDYKKYLIMMAVTALVSEIPYDLSICGKVWDFSSQNAMITMCICLIMLKCLDLFKETSGFTGGMLKALILIAAYCLGEHFPGRVWTLYCSACVCVLCV
ncbi:conjugal transfer protein TraX [Blautia wexlerae]|nr:conjugal transfer protein TraX [Blautia wexlerae]